LHENFAIGSVTRLGPTPQQMAPPTMQHFPMMHRGPDDCFQRA
jgi:hypothetical protein